MTEKRYRREKYPWQWDIHWQKGIKAIYILKDTQERRNIGSATQYRSTYSGVRRFALKWQADFFPITRDQLLTGFQRAKGYQNFKTLTQAMNWLMAMEAANR